MIRNISILKTGKVAMDAGPDQLSGKQEGTLFPKC